MSGFSIVCGLSMVNLSFITDDQMKIYCQVITT
jgi:hypothetical protein